MSNKLKADERIYAAWDVVKEKKDAYDKYYADLAKQYKKTGKMPICTLLMPRPPQFEDVYPLTRAIRESARVATGRSRKKADDLLVLPRAVVEYLIDRTISSLPRKPSPEEERKAAENDQ